MRGAILKASPSGTLEIPPVLPVPDGAWGEGNAQTDALLHMLELPHIWTRPYRAQEGRGVPSEGCTRGDGSSSLHPPPPPPPAPPASWLEQVMGTGPSGDEKGEAQGPGSEDSDYAEEEQEKGVELGMN